MSCVECGVSVEDGDRLRLIAEKYSIPFKCKVCGSLQFNYRPTSDRVFIWPDVIPDKVGSIYIPDQYRANQVSEYGTVLAIGPGFYKSNGTFVPTSVKVGDRVVYDKNVPWSITASGIDGNKHVVKVMGEADIMAFACKGDFIVPIGDRVVVEVPEVMEKTKGGILLPDAAREKSQEAKVVAVGTGKTLDDGRTITLEVKVGDTIVFEKRAVSKVKVGDNEYLIIGSNGIISVVTN
jgi:chaperonin GroES